MTNSDDGAAVSQNCIDTMETGEIMWNGGSFWNFIAAQHADWHAA